MTWLSDRTVERLRAIGSEVDLSSTRYESAEPIGRGGMGTVYRALDTTLQRHVALKVLDAPDPTGELAARLLQEARVLATLDHPGIVPVYDAGHTGEGHPFYAMKLVRGDRLDRWVRGQRSLRERLAVFRHMCDAVAFAHAHQVLHRDLKPQNVMVGQFGEVFVMDWGVAKILVHASPAGTSRERGSPAGTDLLAVRAPGVTPRTLHGAVLGTPGYMPPEQERGEIDQLDERADVYALGTVLGFLTQPPDTVGAKTPRVLRAIIARATAAGPAGRYASVLELAAEVDRFLDGRPVQAHPESMAVRVGRFLWKHRVAVVLLLAYAVVRAVVLLLR